MPTNHLIIGLGGTGERILRSFRKTVFQNFGSENAKGVNVQYLYVDSDDEMMGDDNPYWKILGRSVQLPKTSQLKISGINLAQVLDNVSSYPGISPWLGSREIFRNIVRAKEGAKIFGGQKRRLGRFLFASSAQAFHAQVTELVSGLERGGTAAVTFHVCCGLAGGTGSGCIVDAVSQIRSMYPGSQYQIIVYAFLPEKYPRPEWKKENYHANGYAALLELNALSVGAFRPHDLTGVRKERLELQDPFNVCYLITDENEDHNRVDVKEELPDIVSSFLFQKIVATKDLTWTSLKFQEEYQNMTPDAEESPYSHKPERSRMFFTFGIKQIAYPEEEILEYLMYAFALQAANQLRFNHWTDSQGYTDEPVNQSFKEMVALKETQERWRITDEHLTLSQGILADEIKNPRWKPIDRFWADLLPNFKAHVSETYANNDRAWLTQLEILCQTAFEQNYRDFGVRKFYEIKSGEMKEHVRALRALIERELFEDWTNGNSSMNDISILLVALVESLEERLKLVDDVVVRLKKIEGDFAAKATANQKEWAKIGVLSGLLGKRKDLFEAQGTSLQQLYVLRTRIVGAEFSKKLMQALIAELDLLRSEVGRCAAVIANGAKAFKAGLDARCSDSGEALLDKAVIRFYKPEVIKAFTRTLTRDRAVQKAQTGTVRAEMANRVGDTKDFTNFNSKISEQTLIEALEKLCAANASAAHDAYAGENREISRILNVSVVDRLYREFGGNPEALRTFVANVVSKARNYLCFNSAEAGKSAGKPAPASSLSIIIPKAPDLGQFREALRLEFDRAKTGPKEHIVSEVNPHVITLVNITSVFPARFVQDVDFLREKYDQRLQDRDAEQARAELHLEGDGSGLPNLYDVQVESKKVVAYLLIGTAMNRIQMIEDPETGIKALYLLRKSDKGRELDPMLLGKNLVSAVDELNPGIFDALLTSLQPFLDKEFLHAEKRQALVDSIWAEVDQLKAERKNPLDKMVKTFSQAAQTAETILTQRA